MVNPVHGPGVGLADPAGAASAARHVAAPGGREIGASAPAATASAADVEAAILGWLEASRAESTTARGVAAMRDAIAERERTSALDLGRRRAGKLRRSAMLNGGLGITSGLLQAGEAVLSAFGGKAAQGGGKAMGVASGVLDRIGPMVDSYARDAERLDLRREAAGSAADEAAGGAQSALEHGQVAADAGRRALEILDRCGRADDAAASVALSRQG